ncbi:putative RNA polymerase, Rpb8, nucleic acid-binding protein [Helianthus anomalus]
MVNPHFDDTIKVIGVDADGKKYDKVSRVQAKGEESGMHIVLDVNSQLYPMHAGEQFRMVLSQTLNEDGSAAVAGSEKILDLVPSFSKVHRWSLWFALCSTFSPLPTNLKVLACLRD